jgi:hypothetical protein
MTGWIDLFWIPLGADGHVVRLNGKAYEAIRATLERRPRCDLYHAAIQIGVPEGRYTVEVTPVRDGDGAAGGVVGEGPVGMRLAGRLRLFRYEVRRWRGGEIPDVAHAVASPIRLTDDADVARRALDALPEIPTYVWGRDGAATGDMWNSNSVVSWTLARAGVDVDAIVFPPGGRAPGWQAGIVVARRA